jgi:pilus assembly protein Flp/PilA
MVEARREYYGEEGQGLVEYALILSLLAVVVVAGLTAFGDAVNNLFLMIANFWPSGGT